MFVTIYDTLETHDKILLVRLTRLRLCRSLCAIALGAIDTVAVNAQKVMLLYDVSEITKACEDNTEDYRFSKCQAKHVRNTLEFIATANVIATGGFCELSH